MLRTLLLLLWYVVCANAVMYAYANDTLTEARCTEWGGKIVEADKQRCAKDGRLWGEIK